MTSIPKVLGLNPSLIPDFFLFFILRGFISYSLNKNLTIQIAEGSTKSYHAAVCTYLIVCSQLDLKGVITQLPDNVPDFHKHIGEEEERAGRVGVTTTGVHFL